MLTCSAETPYRTDWAQCRHRTAAITLAQAIHLPNAVGLGKCPVSGRTLVGEIESDHTSVPGVPQVHDNATRMLPGRRNEDAHWTQHIQLQDVAGRVRILLRRSGYGLVWSRIRNSGELK